MQNIKGNVINDVMLSVILYPLVAVQMHDEALAAQNERPNQAQVVTAPPPAAAAVAADRPSREDEFSFPGPPGASNFSAVYVQRPAGPR